MKIELAKSLSGHDKDEIYLILKQEERFAWLVNGTTHTLLKPKKKNTKHFQIIKQIPTEVVSQIEENAWNDNTIRLAVKKYKRSINK